MRAAADPPAAPMRLDIVPMRRRHVREVLAIERLVYPRPWSAALFFSEIAQKGSRTYLCAYDGDVLAGYGGLMVHDDEGHITTIAVAPDHQRRRVGARLMLELLTAARAAGVRTLALEVRVANWPAQRLYSWFGFRPVGVRRNYYAETGEDALVMWVDDVQGDDMSTRLERIRGEVRV